MARGLNEAAHPLAVTRTSNTARGSQSAIAPHSPPALFDSAALANIDWSQAWFAPWRKQGEATAALALQMHSVAAALNAMHTLHAQSRAPNTAPKPATVTFVAQSTLPSTQAYEDFIFRTSEVPTRDGLHDFFNGLCWQRFPHTKRRLNQLQAAEIQAQGIQPTRGPVRDALTLFDENAVLMQAPDAVWAALQARDWLELFVRLREQWQHVHLVLFGHALLEKLVTPYKSITGHVYRVAKEVNSHDDAALDDWLAHDLQSPKLAHKPFEPLPVLGVPGWCAANAERAYYEDTQVFRAKR